VETYPPSRYQNFKSFFPIMSLIFKMLCPARKCSVVGMNQEKPIVYSLSPSRHARWKETRKARGFHTLDSSGYSEAEGVVS